MNIRQMTEEDLDEVCEIETETFSEPWTREDFSNSIKNSNNRYLVAEEQGYIAGYCGYWGIVGEGYIYNVAVRKEYRRRQIGLTMLQELIQQASQMEISSLTLEVRYSNDAAIKLYERLGFVNSGVRKDFYSKPKEDAVIMWLRLIQ